MGDVLPFIAKVRASGDWTAAERARLEELGRQFAETGMGVEVVFGTTEDGDPWCVVKDQNEEVIVHVARIGGRFVVHHAVDDALAEGADLHTALAERLAPADAAQGDESVVVPFSLAGRQAQTFMALIVATAFFYETSAAVDMGDPVEELALESDPPAPPPTPDDVGLTQKREVAAHATVINSTEPAPEAPATAWAVRAEPAAAVGGGLAVAEAAEAGTELPQLAALEGERPAARLALQSDPPTFNLIRGGDGDDVLTGGAGSDRVIGGAGNDTLSGGGAGHGGYDLLQGGAGDDRLEVAADTVAEGGEGADTFVLARPAEMGNAETFLGVILDLRFDEGDQLQTGDGGPVTILPTAPGGTPSAEPPATPGDFGVEQTPPRPDTLLPGFGPGRRVEVDLDGDGVADGYLLVGEMRPAAKIAPPDVDPPVVITGQAIGAWEIG
ncbi:hypothetical protein [Phenylobacterium sp.]|uniref:hypothetical protein n=1 Tax=Phenylobacterium sp. TaxID=1871053 RepID=UPI002FE2763B